MVQHKIVACKHRRKKIERVCEKMGMDNYRYRGDFYSRFFFFFSRHYLIFARTAEEGAPACSIVGLVRGRKSQMSKGLRIGLPVAAIIACNLALILSFVLTFTFG